MGKEVSEFQDQIKELKEFVALATVNPRDYQKINIGIIKKLVNEDKTPGVYVTLNKPYKTLKSLFEREKIDSSLILFIDAVTNTKDKRLEKTKDCLYIGSPENLSDISVAMDEAVRAVPGEKKFVFFDSLSTLLIYNQPGTIAKFIHFLAGKMREWGVKGIIISLEKGANKELIDKLSQFCDVSFDFGE